MLSLHPPRSRRSTPLRSLAALLLLGAGAVNAQTPAAAPLDGAARAAIVEQVSAALDEVYVFPDVARTMGEHIGQQLAAGAYDEYASRDGFAAQLTEDLQSISHDKHLRVRPLPPDWGQDTEQDAAERRERQLASMRRNNYGFAKVELLTGNLGYLELHGFAPAELGGDTAIAAMRLLAHCDALIIDLRKNGGGSPSMIQLLSSYFFAEPVHLNSFYIRRSDSTRQFWSHEHVDGPRLLEVPIYVLTSSRTFSAAEEFSYNLRNLERATLIGETTGGGAHPVEMRPFPELGVGMSLPYGRAINPITGTNWEGTGVEPHIAVAAGEALEVARLEALETLHTAAADGQRRAELEWLIEGLKAHRNPVHLDAAALAAFAGSYGPRRVWVGDDGRLRYRRDDRAEHLLEPLGENRFAFADDEYFRIRFERDAGGAVVALVGLYADGRTDRHARDGS